MSPERLGHARQGFIWPTSDLGVRAVFPLAQSPSDAKYVATTVDLFPPVAKVKVQPVTLQPEDSATPLRMVFSTPELFVFTLIGGAQTTT